MSNNNVNSMSMKKVLLLFFAILSVSMAASAKQQTTVFETEDFENFPSTNPASGSYFDADLTHWFSFIKDNPTYENAVLNGNTDAYHGEKSVRINNSTFNSIPVLLIRPAKKGIVQYYVKMALNGTTITKASESQGIYKINYDSSTSTYTVGTQLCQFPQSLKDGSTEWTLVQAELDEDSYIAITCGGSYIDYYQNIQITLLPNTVSGTITAKDGVTTISGATVDLLDGETVVAEATSADDGTYSFGTDAVPDGAYTLRVSAEQYRTYEAATTISDDKTDLNALLEPKPKYNFSGAVSYNGVAVEGMQLNLAGGDTDVICTTQEDGSFSFTDVLEGTYTLTVYCTPEYMPRTQTIVLDRDITDHEVTLSKYTLLGSVKYLTGEGDEDYVLIEGASVVLKHGDTEIGTATTTANGEFSFSDLSGCDVNDPDDYYTLTASADGFVTESDNISLNGGVNVDKQFVLEWSKSTISGTVVRNDVDVDAALAGIVVELLAGETVVANATSAADGSYSFEIKGALADAGYKLHVAATDYFQEFTADVTPVYQSSVIESIGLDPVLLEYVAVIENEDQEALEGAAITVVKKETKTIDSFEYLGSDVTTSLTENGWTAINPNSFDKFAKAIRKYDGNYAVATTGSYDFKLVREAKAGKVSIFTIGNGGTGTASIYKVTKKDDGSFSFDTQLASVTVSSYNSSWTELSATIGDDCYIGFVIKMVNIDYYVNDFGATVGTAAPAYAAPALTEESGDTPSTIKITKDPIDLKTFTIAIPKVDYSDETYTATASATGATLLTDPSSSTDVWDFKFSDEKHVSVFTGGTPTGVSDISVDSAADADAEYFTLQGVRVTNPHSGIYICRRGSATSKVLIR